MGRRSINTTKSGKYMNPTDQARKEARKKELKKNKKQRQMVRAAVLKGKNPAQLIEEMEKIDEMEYNVLQPSPLNEKVLREKRKKLKETFDRVMRLYNNDDPEMWADLKRREVEYEKRKSKRIQYYESVRTAQSVQIEDIPLPDASGNSDQSSKPALPFPPPKMPADFQPQMAPPNMRPPMSTLPPGLSSRSSLDATAESADTNKPKEDPGVPPFVPPNLLNMRELDSDYESEGDADSGEKESAHNSTEQSSSESDEGRKSDHSEDSTLPKPTSVQQRILAIAGQKYDDFMKELENVHKKKNDQERSRADERASAQSDADKETDRGSRNNFVDNRKGDEPHPLSGPDSNHSVPPPMPRRDNPVMIPNNAAFPAPPMAPPPFTSKMPGLPPPPPPPMGMPMMFRPPMGRPNLPPMGMRMPGMVPRLRMPPAPPPGMPNPRLMQPHKQFNQPQQNVVQQPPKDTKGMTTITAKPQIRNLSADVTRFVPSALRVKREDKKIQKPKPYASEYSRQQQHETTQAKGTTKDDAYMQFMREMQGLL